MTRAPGTSRSHRPARARAFTLLEVVLAALIGSMVLISAFGVFAAMSNTDQRHKVRAAQTNEVSLGYRVLERCFQLLIMEDVPISGEAEARDRIARDLQRAEGLLAEDDGADLENARLLLVSDATAPGVMLMSSGGARRPQLFRIALSAAPIAGGFPESADGIETSPLDRLRQLDYARLVRDEGRSSSVRRGRADDPIGDAEEDWDLDNPEPARAPGVRAELVLLPDGAEPFRGGTARSALEIAGPATFGGTPFLGGANPIGGSDERGWTLWYVEIPARTGADHLTPEERIAALAGDPSLLTEEIDPEDLLYDPDPESFRRIPLMSGLRSLEWQVFRRGKFVPQIAAIGARELPAYVELTFELLNGRRENWLFEVAWTTGPEPGSLLEQAFVDPLDLDPNAPNPTDPNGNPIDPNNPGGGGGGGGGTGGGTANPTAKPTTPGTTGRPGGNGGRGSPRPGKSNLPTKSGAGSGGTHSSAPPTRPGGGTSTQTPLPPEDRLNTPLTPAERAAVRKTGSRSGTPSREEKPR